MVPSKRRVWLWLTISGIAVGVCLTAVALLLLYPPPWKSRAVMRYTYQDGRSRTVGAFWAPRRPPDFLAEGELSLKFLKEDSNLQSGAPQYEEIKIRRLEMWFRDRESRKRMSEALEMLEGLHRHIALWREEVLSIQERWLQAVKSEDWEAVSAGFRNAEVADAFLQAWRSLVASEGDLKRWQLVSLSHELPFHSIVKLEFSRGYRMLEIDWHSEVRGEDVEWQIERASWR